MQPGMTVSAVARLHGLSPSLLFGWRRRLAEGGQVAVQADDDVVAASRVRELELRVRDLERLLGRKPDDAVSGYGRTGSRAGNRGSGCWLCPVAPGRRDGPRLVQWNVRRGTRGWRRGSSCHP